MYEHRKQPLLPKHRFYARLARSLVTSLLLISASLGLGMLGYHSFENQTWLDSFANASMILSGMGPLDPLKTSSGKIFGGFYALFSGFAVLIIFAIIVAPVVHRFFHKFHLEGEKSSSKG